MSRASLITGVDQNDKYRTVRVGEDGTLGSDSGTYQNGGGTITGNFSWIFAHSATVLGSVASGGLGTITNVNLQAGAYWRCCRATSITVTSGEITAYDV
jgi:hypothetical protein